MRSLYGPLRKFAAVVASSDVDPDDLVHDAFANVMRTRRLGEIEFPEAYLRRAILNGARNDRRNRWRLRSLLARLAARESVAVSYQSDLADLERLSPQARAVLYLKVVEGYADAEIAAMLGITEEAARARASRSATQLRLVLIEELGRG